MNAILDTTMEGRERAERTSVSLFLVLLYAHSGVAD